MDNLNRVKKHSIIVATLFVTFMLISMFFNISNITKKQNKLLLEHAKNAYSKDLSFRKWVSMHGGVYVKPTLKTPPNKYLSHVKDRDVVTTTGIKLTLMNPAYTLRELMKNYSGLYGEFGHITSLKLMNEDNKADEWETKVLKNFDKKTYDEYHEILNYKNKNHLRYMKALKIEQSCLKCHSHQEYKVGDIRGGISISIPTVTHDNEGLIEKKYMIFLHVGIIVIVLFIGYVVYQRIINSIRKEMELGKKIKIKEDLLIQQSKMAAMGEMIDNIAHQWRQPLNIISVTSTGVLFKNDLGKLEKDFVNDAMSNINNSVQHLSQTITDFRDFFNPNKKRGQFFIKQTFEKTFKLLESQFKTSGIIIIKNIDDIDSIGFENELIQVFINILNNARDELVKIKKEKKFIFIDVFKENDNLQIVIKDNAGGIPEKIKDKIMDSYFTTKEDFNGTGIGLYMCKIIISEHMNGYIKANNVEFEYEGNIYFGAEFRIVLPKILE